MDLWRLLKDVLLTGTGLSLILSQLFSPHPADVLLVTGLALTVPSAAEHTAGLLRGHGGGQSSPPSSPPGSAPPTPQQEAAGE